VKKHLTGVRSGILDGKHVRAMGEAHWLFEWCVDHQPRGAGGWVKGGQVITYREIARPLGRHRRTIIRWMARLESEGYIEVRRDMFGIRIRVLKQKKWEADEARREGLSAPQRPPLAACVGRSNHGPILTKKLA
jgi:hypothetical protein